MVSYLETQVKRISSILFIFLFDFIQIYFILHLDIQGSDNHFTGYDFSWKDTFTLNNFTIFYLLVSPFILSYISTMSNVTSGGLVQIYGPQSLLYNVKRAFHQGNPDGYDLNDENVDTYLAEMASGQPPGTLDNLKMILSIGIQAEKIIAESGQKSVKRVYMSDQNIPNAFTLRVIPIPFIGQDWIIINRNVVDILDQNEIHAVIAHEIGHAARYDSWINSFLSAPKLMMVFGWSIIFFNLLRVIFVNGFDNLLFIQIIIIFIFFLFTQTQLLILQYLTDYTHRNAELLADYYAANLVGSEILINALIKIGRRAEVLNAVKIDLEWLNTRRSPVNINQLMFGVVNSIDPKEISIENSRKNIIKIYTQAALSELLQSLFIKLSPEDFNTLVDEATEKLCKARDIEKSTLILGGKSLELENWKNVDIDENEILSKDEISELTRRLKESGNSVFENEGLEKLGLLPERKSHPQVGERIIFLHDSTLSEE